MFVHQKWQESRLELRDEIFEEGDDYVTLPPEFFDNLWQPDPYFLNSKVAGKRWHFNSPDFKLDGESAKFQCAICKVECFVMFLWPRMVANKLNDNHQAS